MTAAPQDKTNLNDVKLGHIIETDMFNGILKAPIELVAICYVWQDKDGNQMTSKYKTKNYEEIDDEDDDE